MIIQKMKLKRVNCQATASPGAKKAKKGFKGLSSLEQWC